MNIGPADMPLDHEKKIQQALDFFHDYYNDTEHHGKPILCKKERLMDVFRQLRQTETYSLTKDELTWGARTAWRNASRCSARILWKTLRVLDCRNVADTDGMFQAICYHLDVSVKGGVIEPCISVFRKREANSNDIRVWNKLLMAFAGYAQEDGSIIGDPSNVELTQFCQSLGWVGNGGNFDLLPWVFGGNDGIPHWYEIPKKFQLLVDIIHPTIDAISNMNIKWFGVPAVSNMMFEVGGLQFTAAPFTGWYQTTEIANRDLLDEQRYNLLEPIGRAMKLDMSSNATFWKDIVGIEMNRAVLHSYRNAGVSIVDHYTQAEQFMEHLKVESQDRGGCKNPHRAGQLVRPQLSAGARIPP